MATRRRGKLRWGIISTANIGVARVIPPMMESNKFEVYAISSRDQKKADEAAAKLGIPVAHGSYEALLDDPDVDIVYNPLPNHLHVPLTLDAAAKGKHVLCEKPIAMTAAEARKLKKIPEDIVVGEAFMVRHHPQWKRAREIVQSGKLGTVRFIQVAFSYHNVDPNNVRNMADIGGGGVYDIGCYAIITGRYLYGAEPERVVSLIDRDPNFRTDRTASALLDFGDGRQLAFSTSTQTTPFQRVQVLGTKGRLEIRIPYNAPSGEQTLLFLDDGKKLADESAKPIRIAKTDQYRLQAEAFTRAVQGKEELEFGIDDAIAQMKVIDAVFRSEKQNRWIKL